MPSTTSIMALPSARRHLHSANAFKARSRRIRVVATDGTAAAAPASMDAESEGDASGVSDAMWVGDDSFGDVATPVACGAG